MEGSVNDSDQNQEHLTDVPDEMELGIWVQQNNEAGVVVSFQELDVALLHIILYNHVSSKVRHLGVNGVELANDY